MSGPQLAAIRQPHLFILYSIPLIAASAVDQEWGSSSPVSTRFLKLLARPLARTLLNICACIALPGSLGTGIETGEAVKPRWRNRNTAPTSTRWYYCLKKYENYGYVVVRPARCFTLEYESIKLKCTLPAFVGEPNLLGSSDCITLPTKCCTICSLLFQTREIKSEALHLSSRRNCSFD